MRPGLVVGVNVDRVDVAAALELAARFGYDSAEHQMVAEYALRRHARGEEDGAQRSALSGGIDLTSWYAILAAALSAAQPAAQPTPVAAVWPPGCGQPGCASHYASRPPFCICPEWRDSGGYHIVMCWPGCTAHRAAAGPVKETP